MRLATKRKHVPCPQTHPREGSLELLLDGEDLIIEETQGPAIRTILK